MKRDPVADFRLEISWTVIEPSMPLEGRCLETVPRERVELRRLALSAFKQRPSAQMNDLVRDVENEGRYVAAR